ncbi:MAG: hypothetical protein JW741_00825 [Sedimentisphaerales bacterium]|nr:hypothetical protein [Sedimentisphaerales bacterium]
MWKRPAKRVAWIWAASFLTLVEPVFGQVPPTVTAGIDAARGDVYNVPCGPVRKSRSTLRTLDVERRVAWRMGFLDLFILIGILMTLPLWVFWFPLIVLLVVCMLCRERAIVRNACIVCSVLILMIAIPASVVHLAFMPDGDSRLRTYFGNVIQPDSITRYRFQLAGLGETKDYWKLKNVDPNRCQRIIEKHSLEMAFHDKPFSPRSRAGAPWWWPNSTKGYSVFASDDGQLSRIEIWIWKDSSRVYLFKFTE